MKSLWRCLAALATLALVAFGQAAQPAPGTLKFAELGNFKLSDGQIIRNCRLGYRTFGELNPGHSNAVLIPTWFSGTTGKMLDLVGPGKLVDSSKYFVILVGALGDGVSSSPSNSTLQPRMQFPRFTIRDMVNAEYQLATQTLGLHHLHAVMGISMGGMQTFQWAVAYPTFMDIAIPIVGSPRLTSYDLMLWHTEIATIREDSGWNNGNYTTQPKLNALADLHNLELTSPAFRVRTTTPVQFPEFVRETEAAGPGFDANDWIRQAQAMMAQDVTAPFGGSMARTVQTVKAKMLIIPSKNDHMVNPTPALEFARLRHARVLLLTSDCGHLATSCESAKLDAAVAAFLANPQ